MRPQVESRACLDHLEEMLAVPGVTCAYLGPADMALSLGLHERHNYDMAAALGSNDMALVEQRLLKVGEGGARAFFFHSRGVLHTPCGPAAAGGAHRARLGPSCSVEGWKLLRVGLPACSCRKH